MTSLVRRFAANENGASAIEYCILACFVSLALIVAANQIGVNLTSRLNAVASSLGSDGTTAVASRPVATGTTRTGTSMPTAVSGQ